MRKIQNKKGVTLIALVITIVVMIIIAGAAITIGIDKGAIREQAENATERLDSRIASEQEKINALFEDIDADAINQVKDPNPGTLEKNGSIYTINSVEDLLAFAYNVNKNAATYSGKTVKLGLNLDIQNDRSYANPQSKYVLDSYGYSASNSGTAIKQLLTDTTGVGFVSIGNQYGDGVGFGGTFDGNNHCIKNLYQNSNNYGGFFGNSNNSATISNLGIIACNMRSAAPIGAIIGQISLTITITNCHCSGSVNSPSPAGGIIGQGSSATTIRNCYSSSSVNSNAPAGGIIGWAPSTTTIENCYNTGNISASYQVGGMVGGGNSRYNYY
ncbi:MAG: hypothetical protein IKP28_03640 [Clostridia bacterium]|nr:hypothetical protein [Clostridia bacterium]